MGILKKIMIGITCLIILALITAYIAARIIFRLDYFDIIQANAAEHDVSPLLIASIIKAESGFNSTAVSHRGAIGLMQVMPATGEWSAERMGLESFETSQLFTPETNIQIGTWYFASYLMTRFDGNLVHALAAYNAGPTNAERWDWNEEIPFPETRFYVQRVQQFYRIYRFLYPRYR